MQVILLERVNKLGQMGETVKVQATATPVTSCCRRARRCAPTKPTRSVSNAERATLEARNLERRKSEAQKSPTLSPASPSSSSVRLAKPASSTVRSPARDIVEILAAEGFNIGRNQVELEHPDQVDRPASGHAAPACRSRADRSNSTSPVRLTKLSARPRAKASPRLTPSTALTKTHCVRKTSSIRKPTWTVTTTDFQL